MNTIKTIMRYGILLLFSSSMNSAGDIAGRITDEKNRPLSNVNLVLQSTEFGAVTDSSGYYFISGIPAGEYLIRASRIGYKMMVREVNIPVPDTKTVDLILPESVIELSEVTVTGTMATDMKAPVTFNTIGEKEIASKHSVQDIPLLLTQVPGIYVMTDGGVGFGDSKIMIRGFDEKRLQVLVNNIPVNNPETKEVAWSNWGVLPDAAQAIQVQRGVGTSLYGTAAIGGSINIITKDAALSKNTRLIYYHGQFGVRKIGVDYNSGYLKGKKSFVVKINFYKGQDGAKIVFSADSNITFL